MGAPVECVGVYGILDTGSTITMETTQLELCLAMCYSC